MSKAGDGKIGFWPVAAIGVGVMVRFVITLYVPVALVAVGNLSVGKIVPATDYALAEAARLFLGRAGFTLIAVAAMLSTASAINATLYGAARLSYCIEHDGELPATLERQVWCQAMEGLFITTGLTLLVANAFDLTSIVTLGSAGFLLITAAVNAAKARDARHTGSRVWISVSGAFAYLLALGALIWHTSMTAPAKLWVLAAMVASAMTIEGGYRRHKRELRLRE